LKLTAREIKIFSTFEKLLFSSPISSLDLEKLSLLLTEKIDKNKVLRDYIKKKSIWGKREKIGIDSVCLKLLIIKND
jgi:hypothetical protein